MSYRVGFLSGIFLAAAIGISLLAAALLTGGWVAASVGRALTPPETVQTADVIFVAGNNIRRVIRGLELYAQGFSRQIVVTGVYPDHRFESQTALNRLQRVEIYGKAVDYNVPIEAIIFLHTTSTLEDAQVITDYMDGHAAQSALVVTDWYHGRRMMCTLHSGDTSAHQFRYAATSTSFAPNDWWQAEIGVDAVWTEIVKIAYYRFAHGVPISGCWQGDFSIGLFGLFAGAALTLGWIGTGLIRNFTLRRSLLDLPNQRSSHAVPTPRGGGLAIFAVTIFLLITWLVFNGLGEMPLAAVLAYILSALILAAVALYDDWVKDVKAQIRFGFHVLAAFLLMVGLVLPVESLASIPPMTLFLSFVAIISACLWLVFLTNVYNFMDGIDGIAALSAVCAGLAWTLLMWLEGQTALTVTALLVTMTSLAFLWHNAPPALIFMGDVGSTFLGFTFAAFPLLAYEVLGDMRLWVTGLCFVVPFVLDGGYTILCRLRRRERIWTAHRTHIYQRLVITGLSHGFVTAYYGLLALVFIACGYVFYANRGAPGWAALFLVVLLGVLHIVGCESFIQSRQVRSRVA